MNKTRNFQNMIALHTAITSQNGAWRITLKRKLRSLSDEDVSVPEILDQSISTHEIGSFTSISYISFSMAS